MATRSEAQKARWARKRAESETQVEPIALLRDVPDSLTEALRLRDARILELEEEVRQLKRQLAAKAIASPIGRWDVRATDPFAHLPKADREWMERKAGTKKK